MEKWRLAFYVIRKVPIQSGFHLVRIRLEGPMLESYFRSAQGSNMNILILQLGTVLTNTTKAKIPFKEDGGARSHSPQG